MLTMNDYKILQAIISRDDKTKGITKINGTTINEIVEKTGLSIRKVRDTKEKLIKLGFIKEGIKIVNQKTFLITKLGLEELKDTIGGYKNANK